MGGMGGMGGMRGMGGMGGFFDVQDDLSLGTKAAGQKPADASAEPADRPARRKRSPQPRDAAGEPSAEPIELQRAEGESLDEAWDRFFRQHDGITVEQAQVLDSRFRATARELSRKEKYDEIVAMLQASMRHAQAQPWMYEALGVAMLAGDYPQLEVERALTSAMDMSHDLDVMMSVAMYLARLEHDRRALDLFRQVAFLNPLRPEPYALGLASAKRLDDVDGIRWATLGILSQAWPKENSGIEDRARRLAKATIARLRGTDRAEEAAAYEEAMQEAQQRDITASVSWTGEADIDVAVEEPAGTVCSLQNRRTAAGGVILGDAYSAGSGSGKYTETYVCPKGFNGQYRLLIRRVWGEVTAGKVTVDIRTSNPDRPHIRAQVPLGEKDALVLFDLTNGRRTEQVAHHHLDNLEKPIIDADRSLVTRQLSRHEDSLASRDFVRDRAYQRGWRGGGPLGFQPQLTTLSEGAGLSGNGALAVVSADRRYVRIQPFPMFSQIGQVDTFDFGGGIEGGLPDDDDDDDDDTGDDDDDDDDDN